MKKIIVKFFAITLFLAGMVFIFYNPISNFFYQKGQDKIVSEFENTFDNPEENNKEEQLNSHSTKSQSKGTWTMVNNSAKSKASSINIEELRAAVKAYNKKIYEQGQHGIKDTSSYQTEPINLYNFGFQNKVYGYITIEKIGVKMALYLGASESNMAMGAATLNYTSIPYGGKNTNSVIAGHCGYGGSNYFRYIENLKSGDIVEIRTPFNKLKYKVYDRKIYNPKVFDEIKIQENRDLLTLFTCYPYPTSEKRLCVFCERV